MIHRLVKNEGLLY